MQAMFTRTLSNTLCAIQRTNTTGVHWQKLSRFGFVNNASLLLKT